MKHNLLPEIVILAATTLLTGCDKPPLDPVTQQEVQSTRAAISRAPLHRIAQTQVKAQGAIVDILPGQTVIQFNCFTSQEKCSGADSQINVPINRIPTNNNQDNPPVAINQIEVTRSFGVSDNEIQRCMQLTRGFLSTLEE